MSVSAERSAGFAVWLFAVGQTLGYCCLYYVYGALLVSVEADTGWSRPDMGLGFTLALLISAVFVSRAGRVIDRGLGVELLGFGAALGAVGLVILSQAETLAVWYIGWAVIGLAMAASLYDMCFAFLTRRLAERAGRAIINVSLVAGLASTLAFPLGAYLAEALGWRGALLVFAAMQGFMTAPLHFVGGRILRRGDTAVRVVKDRQKGVVPAAMKKLNFWLIALCFGLTMLAHMMLVTYFIPVFMGYGVLHGTAIAAASLVGPFQVVGRLILLANSMRVSAPFATIFAAGGMALATGLLLMAGAQSWLIFAFAMIQGASLGMNSILRPMVIADVMSRDNFGAVSGAIAAVPLVGVAIAPYAGALFLEAGGNAALVGASLAFAVISTVLAIWLRARFGHSAR